MLKIMGSCDDGGDYQLEFGFWVGNGWLYRFLHPLNLVAVQPWNMCDFTFEKNVFRTIIRI